ncbi:MAG: class I SAM-dependent methyltransferase [Proteobacteria bacterium]|nr:class I SAM-dependent methyltransferase [Pseudomonadota bacterium]
MAYHGYIPFIKQLLLNIESPKVLEVGTDKGMSTIPLVVFLLRLKQNFEFVGIDVLVQESLKIMLKNIEASSTQKISLYQDSSLNVLPALANDSNKFDVILLDGDHNYYTVSSELKHLDKLLSDDGIAIVDDYHGRWADKDLWYSERDEYQDVSNVTKKVETEKRGVKPAVDEFLEENPGWESGVLMQGEPIILKRKRIEKSMFSQSLFEK